MNLGFKTEFPDKTPTDFVQQVLDDIKIHSIREDKNNRWVKDMVIHFCTGIRTKKYNCFKIGKCVSTQSIEFKWRNHNKGMANESWSVQVFIDGRDLTNFDSVIDELVKNDGFKDRKSFFEWESWYRKDFTGKIIHWTNKLY